MSQGILGNLMKKKSLHHNKRRNGRTERASFLGTPIFGLGNFVWVILFFLLIGCVKTEPIVTYQTLHEKTFQSRAEPASLSQKSAKTLIQEGFVKIGSLNVNVLKKICRHFFVGGKTLKINVKIFLIQIPFPCFWKRGIRWEVI